MKNRYKKYFSPVLISFFALTAFFSVSCTRTEPKISYGFIQLVQYQTEAIPQEFFSFFIMAEDEDGFENLGEINLFHDREQLRWNIKSGDWLHYSFEGKDWIGTRSIAVHEGSLPRGVFRAQLINKGGESTEKLFTYDGGARYPFPQLEISRGVYTINSQWPVNHLVFYDGSGNYTNTVVLDSLTGEMSQFRLPSSVRTAALWAEDEANFCSAFTNVVLVH